MSLEAIQAALKTVKYPGFSRDIVSFGLVRSTDFQDGKAIVSISVSTKDHAVPTQIRDDAEAALKAVPGVEDVEVNVSIAAPKQAPAAEQGQQPMTSRIKGVKYVLAVASGKGGVGKSTFAVNLAVALSKLLKDEGKKVGLMDCDIYGPSLPLMLGAHGRPSVEDESLVPLENHGIKVMSMGFLVDSDTPVIWRGPMIMKTVKQFVENVIWGDLEFLVVDLPPGTGDAQLSLVQTVELDGALIVTTPQLASTQVALRGARMLQKTNVPLLGVAENMSYLLDSSGGRQAIFGEGGGQKTAEALNAPLLGQIPLDPQIGICGDSGNPIALSNPQSEAALAFAEVAEAIRMQLNS